MTMTLMDKWPSPARTCLRDERRDAIFGRDDARAAAAPHRPRAPDPGRRALARRGARRRRAREDARRRRPRASSTPRFPGSFRRVDKTLGFDERESTPRATPRAGRDERATDATSARAARVDGWLSRRTRTSLIACATTLNPPRCASRGARHRDAPSASARRDDASPNATDALAGTRAADATHARFVAGAAFADAAPTVRTFARDKALISTVASRAGGRRRAAEWPTTTRVERRHHASLVSQRFF